MKLIVKHFNELTTSELYEIYKLRNSVFIVEQACPYQDIDEADKSAYHIWLKDDDGIEAYLRILPKGVNFNEVSLGRVIAVKRHCGLGTRIVKEGMNIAKERLNAECIVIEAYSILLFCLIFILLIISLGLSIVELNKTLEEIETNVVVVNSFLFNSFFTKIMISLNQQLKKRVVTRFLHL